MNLLNEIWEKWKNAETPEMSVAYMECYMLVREYIQENE